MIFLEEMRLRWHDGESKDKIIGVYYLKQENKILLKLKVYDWLDLFADIRYYTVCPESGRLTKADKPQRSAYSVLLGKEAMTELYRHPFGQSCKRTSRVLYVECYRNGACSTEKQKRLYRIFAGKCIRQEMEHSREYLKWAHQQAAKRWEGYEGQKSYAQIFKETLATDSIMGSKTLATVNVETANDKTGLYNAYRTAWVSYFHSLGNANYSAGWTNRMDTFFPPMPPGSGIAPDEKPNYQFELWQRRFSGMFKSSDDAIWVGAVLSFGLILLVVVFFGLKSNPA